MTGERLVILVNSGVTMSRGKYAAQAIHAALNALGVHPGCSVVVLGGTRAEIEACSVQIRDAGVTELVPGTLTAGVSESPTSNGLVAPLVVRQLAAERDTAVAERDALRELLTKERAESERLRAAVRHAELFGTAFIWRDPSTGEELVLHPADVTVVIPDGQLTEIERLRAAAKRDAHIITLLRRFVAEGFTAGTGSAGADLAAAVKAAYPEGGQP